MTRGSFCRWPEGRRGSPRRTGTTRWGWVDEPCGSIRFRRVAHQVDALSDEPRCQAEATIPRLSSSTSGRPAKADVVYGDKTRPHLIRAVTLRWSSIITVIRAQIEEAHQRMPSSGVSLRRPARCQTWTLNCVPVCTVRRSRRTWAGAAQRPHVPASSCLGTTPGVGAEAKFGALGCCSASPPVSSTTRLLNHSCASPPASLLAPAFQAAYTRRARGLASS